MRVSDMYDTLEETPYHENSDVFLKLNLVRRRNLEIRKNSRIVISVDESSTSTKK